MAKAEEINYELPSGFNIELLPGEKRLELYLLDKIRQVFEQYGFTPIETPVVERLEVLQAKGNQGDNIIYGISPILPTSDHSGINEGDGSKSEKRALKFDQTVPLAAYIARHLNDLTFPFARYQMDMVFRGERAKSGRYRQFRQCDIDVVGRGSLSLLYDAQVPAIIAQIFESIKIGDFLIRINNRKILTGFFKAIGVAEEKAKSCIRIVDTMEKVGENKVKSDLEAIGVSESQANEIISFTRLEGSVDSMLEQLEQKSKSLGNPENFDLGISELKEVVKGVRSLGVAENRFCIDLAIARGLAYYTGTVYETSLIGYEGLGSICSGGRYEELVGIFVGEKMPGVGISIGLTRLMRRLMEISILSPMSASPAQVMVLNLQSDLMDTYFRVSQQLRNEKINVLTSFEERPIGKQYQQAEKLGIPLCVVIGDKEHKTGMARIKILKTGEQFDVSLDNLVEEVKSKLS